jgi:hypothetical protein
MFFTGLATAIPGAAAPVETINAMGTASIVWFAVPAALVLAGSRRLHWFGFVAIGLALVAVGVTMYNRGPLNVHLATIFAAVVVLALVATVFALPPRMGSRGSLPAHTR